MTALTWSSEINKSNQWCQKSEEGLAREAGAYLGLGLKFSSEKDKHSVSLKWEVPTNMCKKTWNARGKFN